MTEAINSVHESLKLEFAQVEANAAGFQALLDTLTTQEQLVLDRISALNTADIEIKRLERELTLAESNYMTYAKNLEEGTGRRSVERECYFQCQPLLRHPRWKKSL